MDHMKKCCFTLFVLLMAAGVQAQVADKKYTTTNFNASVDSVAEALVALAMNNPSIKAAGYLATQFKWLYKESKTSWMNNIAVQGNLNEYSFNQNNVNTVTGQQNTQYPKYNFGVIIPLGIFVNNPKQVKSDYYKYLSLSEQVNVERQNIRRDVLINYHDYVMNKQLVTDHQDLVNSWHIINLKNEKKFTNGDITLEAFTNSTKSYTDELTKQMNLEDAMKVSAARLEALIGMNIEDALMQIKAGK
jgi:outer membrane protein TolC